MPQVEIYRYFHTAIDRGPNISRYRSRNLTPSHDQLEGSRMSLSAPQSLYKLDQPLFAHNPTSPAIGWNPEQGRSMHNFFNWVIFEEPLTVKWR